MKEHDILVALTCGSHPSNLGQFPQSAAFCAASTQETSKPCSKPLKPKPLSALAPNPNKHNSGLDPAHQELVQHVC